MKGTTRDLGFSTRAIHAGQPPDPRTGAVAVPIYQTSTYVQLGLGEHQGYEYARVQNPTREALEQNLAQLEGGVSGHAFASGMAAIASLMTLVKAGEHVVVSRNVYGGTYRYFTQVLERNQVSFSWVDSSKLDAVGAAMTPATRMVFIETPTNPVMDISDIAGSAEIAHAHEALLVVDNTFLSPYLQRPLERGADLVVHSTTKFLNGHSDSVGGAVVCGRQQEADWLFFMQKSMGAILSPFDSFLVMRGVKTLAVRMEQHERNAAAVVGMLAAHPKVRQVLYPGLPDHPGRDVHCRQASGFGSMITLEMGTHAAAKTLLESVKVLSLAESLGGVESLISHPATMTHASVPTERRIALGLTDSMVRISVGIEDAGDLLADLDQALAKV
ncbi:MAG TPA: PLP-dependent aspartate aminotransferase family protein [Thermoanaerobaculia bacterium]|nr:PLP-dependent aspartate aminotransferase family protein [Thermoanaerobaculia bacterium]